MNFFRKKWKRNGHCKYTIIQISREQCGRQYIAGNELKLSLNTLYKISTSYRNHLSTSYWGLGLTRAISTAGMNSFTLLRAVRVQRVNCPHKTRLQNYLETLPRTVTLFLLYIINHYQVRTVILLNKRRHESGTLYTRYIMSSLSLTDYSLYRYHSVLK